MLRNREYGYFIFAGAVVPEYAAGNSIQKYFNFPLPRWERNVKVRVMPSISKSPFRNYNWGLLPPQLFT
jgi:hypothetical protein